jgi:hypothetical protein
MPTRTQGTADEPVIASQPAGASLLRLPSVGLLLSLLALILLEPLAEEMRGGLPLLAVIHFSVMGLAVRLVASTRSERRWIWPLAGLTMVLNVVGLSAEEPQLVTVNLALLGVFYAYVIRCLVLYTLRDAVVTVDELFAAACTYVLMAMAFACVYAIQERLAPGSFAFSSSLEESGQTRVWDLLYFSFTVLTSTGFGDIHPLARAARAVVVVEQVTGVMFVAILIARLTGMVPIARPPHGS